MSDYLIYQFQVGKKDGRRNEASQPSNLDEEQAENYMISASRPVLERKKKKTSSNY